MKRRRWTRLCEIGSSLGEATELLCDLTDLRITTIDPCLDADLVERFAGNAQIEVKKGLSLDILPQLSEPFNCILIDGDHNWYTVYNELKVISERKLLRKGGVIFLHDVGFPWARRDLYYQPNTIPAAYRHEIGYQAIIQGRNGLAGDVGPFAGCAKAVFEGGERNGVLTAIEDFLKENQGDYRFSRVRAGSGLGAMLHRGGFRDDLSFLVLRGKGVIYSAAYCTVQFVKSWGRRH